MNESKEKLDSISSCKNPGYLELPRGSPLFFANNVLPPDPFWPANPEIFEKPEKPCIRCCP